MITLTDIFAGAGGSSTGAIQVPGVRVSLAANHWALAVQVHNANHPTTRHACVDLHMEDPRNFPRTDILWASPECTKWSIANSKAKALSVEMGGDPSLFDDVPDELISSDEDEISRSRLLMFDVLRFVEYHRYRAVIVENVVDIATQGKYARAWAAWRRNLRKLGYQFRVVSLNSMHAGAFGLPAPQSRDRLYIVAWPEKEKTPDIDRVQRPKAWCPRCDAVVESAQSWKRGRTVGRYRAQYVYVCTRCWKPVEPMWLPASTAIDWSIKGQRIGDRAKPLSPKTMARIREGLRRYGHEFLTIHRGDRKAGVPDNRVQPLTDPAPALTASGNFLGMVVPSGGSWSESPYPVSDPHRAFLTRGDRGLLIPTEGRDGKRATRSDRPMRTQTCRNELGILTMLRGTNAPKLTDEPLDTMAASGNHHGLLVPYYGASDTGKPTSHPIGTLPTRDHYALIMRNNTPRGDAGQMVTPAYEPMRTLTAVGAGQSVLEPTTIDPEDCTFRMLEPHEIAAGMSFPADYRWAGTKRERVRLAGNAVTPPAARDLVHAIAESLGAA